MRRVSSLDSPTYIEAISETQLDDPAQVEELMKGVISSDIFAFMTGDNRPVLLSNARTTGRAVKFRFICYVEPDVDINEYVDTWLNTFDDIEIRGTRQFTLNASQDFVTILTPFVSPGAATGISHEIVVTYSCKQA